MRKFNYFIDYDKEEEWLIHMAKKGFELENVAFGYKFHRTAPQDLTIKIDFRQFQNQKAFVDYCTLFEDSGWKHIAGSKHTGKQYFKRTSGNSDDDIFSDRESKAVRYNKLSIKLLRSAIMSFLALVILANLNYIDLNAFVNPKSFYLTPGLWEMKGSSFWTAFWFESPFAAFRALLFASFPTLIILHLIFAYKAKKKYEMEIHNDLF